MYNYACLFNIQNFLIRRRGVIKNKFVVVTRIEDSTRISDTDKVCIIYCTITGSHYGKDDCGFRNLLSSDIPRTGDKYDISVLDSR